MSVDIHLHSPHVQLPAATAGLPTVLIVEDEKKMRWWLIEQFRAMDIAPFTAQAGYEAIRVAAEERPDLVILDGLLPEMHGFEVGRFIRHLDSEYRPYIVVLTAVYKHSRYRNEARTRYGVDEYLLKPVDPQSLAQLVQRVKDRL
jgi:DNA-binding response OmpR family regulator